MASNRRPNPINIKKPTDPWVEYISVTPATATRWLANNEVNRTIRARKVDKYADEMKQGLWTANNDSICLNPEGMLLNGQHRLSAIVQNNKPQLLTVQFNVPEAAMANMDTAIPRSTADVLNWRHEKHAAILGAVARLACVYMDGRIMKDTKVQLTTNHEIIEFIDTYPTIRESAHMASTYTRRINGRPSIIGVTHWLIAETDEPKHADQFIEQLASRANEPLGSAVLALDSRLTEIKRNRQHYEPREYLSLFLKAWNYWASAAPVKKLNIITRSSGDFKIPVVSKWNRDDI